MRRRWGGAENEGIFDSEHAEQWGVWLPASSIGSIAHSFLDGLAAVHGAHAPVLRRQLAKDGGYAMHVDGTCEVDTEVLFTALAEPRGWTLEVAKMTGENTEEIKKSVVPSSPIPQRLEDLPEH